MSNYMTYLFAWHIRNMKTKLPTLRNYTGNGFISSKSGLGGGKYLTQSRINSHLEEGRFLEKPTRWGNCSLMRTPFRNQHLLNQCRHLFLYEQYFYFVFSMKLVRFPVGKGLPSINRSASAEYTVFQIRNKGAFLLHCGTIMQFVFPTSLPSSTSLLIHF